MDCPFCKSRKFSSYLGLAPHIAVLHPLSFRKMLERIPKKERVS